MRGNLRRPVHRHLPHRRADRVLGDVHGRLLRSDARRLIPRGRGNEGAGSSLVMAS